MSEDIEAKRWQKRRREELIELQKKIEDRNKSLADAGSFESKGTEDIGSLIQNGSLAGIKYVNLLKSLKVS